VTPPTGGFGANGVAESGTTLSGDNGITAGAGAIGPSSSTGGGNGSGPGGSGLPASGASRHGKGKRSGGGGLVSGVTLPLPWGRGGLDRLTALVLGIGLFLLVRKPLERCLRYLTR
jgi:hypothetical protein